jgi:HK97 family phage major capsid protein
MKLDNNKMKEAKEQALKILQNTEDKSQAVADAVETLVSAYNSELIQEITEQANKAESDKDYAKSLNLRVLSSKEKEFYALIQNVKQAVTANQIDIIPNTIIDVTLEDVKKESGILSYVNFAPANVKKWISASKTGAYSWGGLTDVIRGELTASFALVDMDVSKLTVYMIIPKAISELALPFVDKYFKEVLKEQLNDGLEYGFLQGSGKNEPIGIYKKIAEVNEDQTHKDKILNTDLTSFKPKALAPAKKYLNKNGKRVIDELVLICHPNDEADYVAPAIYNDEGKLISSYKNMVVKTSANNPIGKAALFIPKKYTLGLNNLGIKEFDQTLALDDADLVIGKGYSNGRASDDNVAYVFDVTKLEEYIPTVKTIEVVQGA